MVEFYKIERYFLSQNGLTTSLVDDDGDGASSKQVHTRPLQAIPLAYIPVIVHKKCDQIVSRPQWAL
jgi:hypothetical protein